jgi:uncharacterized membrane protein YgdD (TMEM256/DUF423 family)
LGVALGAAGAHLPQAGDFTRLASTFLLLHAGAALGVASFARLAYFHRSLILFGFVMLLGAGLFSADLVFHDFYSDRLFPLAAPVGGTATLVGWAALLLTFLIESARRRH